MDLYVFTWSNGLFNFFSKFSKYNPLVELINSLSSIILSYLKLFQVSYKVQMYDAFQRNLSNISDALRGFGTICTIQKT